MDPQRLTRIARTLDWRISRRSALAVLSAAGLTTTAAAAQATPTDATVLGRSAPGANAFEFVGRINQDGMNFTLLGYITYLAGIEQNALFFGDDPLARTEAQSRLTLFGSATGVSRSIVDRVFAVNAEGQVQVHATADAGANFDDPMSFAVGDPVCTMSLRIQNIITVYAPQQGLANGVGELSLDITHATSLGDMPIVFGQEADAYRLTLNGQGELLDPERLVAVIAVGGSAVLTTQSS